MQTYRNVSEAKLKQVAGEILNKFPEQRMFALYGKMGAGKTTMIKAFSEVMKVEDEVNSPTFSLINEYYSPEYGSVFHFDFYRLEKIEEVYDIGYEDYFFSGSYCFLEWPEKISELLPENFVYLKIEITDNQARTVRACRAG